MLPPLHSPTTHSYWDQLLETCLSRKEEHRERWIEAGGEIGISERDFLGTRDDLERAEGSAAVKGGGVESDIKVKVVQRKVAERRETYDSGIGMSDDEDSMGKYVLDSLMEDLTIQAEVLRY